MRYAIIILFLLIISNPINAQWNPNKDTVYEGTIALEGRNHEVRMLTIHLSFHSSLLLDMISENLGDWQTIYEERFEFTKVIEDSPFLKKHSRVIVEKNVIFDKHIKKEELHLYPNLKGDEVLIFYCLDKKGNDILNRKTKRRLKSVLDDALEKII